MSSSETFHQALEEGLQQQFLSTRYWHIVGTAITGPVLVLVVWDFGSPTRLLGWLAAHLLSVTLLALAYSGVTSQQSGDSLYSQRFVHGATLVNGVVMGLAAWVDLDALDSESYALGIVASLLAFGAGTLVNLSPLTRLVYATTLPTFGLTLLALVVAQQWVIACAVGAFMTVVASRPMALARRSFEELIALRQEAQLIANSDDLTGLLNRRGFLERVEERLVRGETGALLFIDLDRFKQVNDQLGHTAGDTLLIEVARRLQRCTDGSIELGRIGGDEFAVFAADMDEPVAAELARSFSDAFVERFLLGNQAVSLRASIGVADSTHQARTAEALLRNADVAMYCSKRATVPISMFSECEPE
jgi:diguanylate cyclase (GGDEF)-like protein